MFGVKKSEVQESPKIKVCKGCGVEPEFYVGQSEEYYRCPSCHKQAATLEEWDSINS